jgi:hypothetical protein
MKNDIQELKKAIKKRFGSIKRFCKVMNENKIVVNYISLTNAFSGRTSVSRQEYIVNFVKVLLNEPKFEECLQDQISDVEREEIRIQILKNFKNVCTFSKLHEDFNQVFVHNVISGKRKRRDKRFIELQNTLKS